MAVDIILPDPVIRLIRKKNIPFTVCSSPFRKAELVGDPSESIARDNNGVAIEEGGLSLYQAEKGQTGNEKTDMLHFVNLWQFSNLHWQTFATIRAFIYYISQW